jgi:hypothetical protein
MTPSRTRTRHSIPAHREQAETLSSLKRESGVGLVDCERMAMGKGVEKDFRGADCNCARAVSQSGSALLYSSSERIWSGVHWHDRHKG